jgi:uncharacterized protein with WD repeat
VNGAVEIAFSPKGSFLSTWERYCSSFWPSLWSLGKVKLMYYVCWSLLQPSQRTLTLSTTTFVSFPSSRERKSWLSPTNRKRTGRVSSSSPHIATSNQQLTPSTIRQPSFPPSESHLIRVFNNEILLFAASSLTPKSSPISRFKVEGLKGIWVGGGSEGEGVAVFVGEKNGAPANMSLYSIQTLSGASPTATASKTFYKADKVVVKWNDAGSMVRIFFSFL